MDKTKLKEMEVLDAKIEKINYDLSGLETRKKEMEDKKFEKQREIEDLEKEKRTILAKTDKMNRLEKIIYIAFASKNDLKQIDLLNVKITEHRNEKDSIQNKIDIQNKLYADTIKEKDSCVEQRRQLYIENTKESTQEQNKSINQIKDLTRIYEIAIQYPNNATMKSLRNLVEKQINKQLVEDKVVVSNEQLKTDKQEQEEM